MQTRVKVFIDKSLLSIESQVNQWAQEFNARILSTSVAVQTNAGALNTTYVIVVYDAECDNHPTEANA